MFNKILIAKRGCPAAQPNRLLRAAHGGDCTPMEETHV